MTGLPEPADPGLSKKNRLDQGRVKGGPIEGARKGLIDGEVSC